MTYSSLPKREDLPIEETWDLTDLIQSEDHLNEELNKMHFKSKEFFERYFNCISDHHQLSQAIKEIQEIETIKNLVKNYADLSLSVDQTNIESQARVDKVNHAIAKADELTFFLYLEINKLPDDQLDSLITEEPSLAPFIKRTIEKNKHMLSYDEERILLKFSPITLYPRSLYNTTKLADIQFDDFKVKGKKHRLNYNDFENVLEISPNTEVRRRAFTEFSKELKKYQHTTAKTYSLHLMIEKTMSDLRGFDNIFDYLLYDHRINRNIFDRQIDYVMKYLAPHMRKYAKLIKKIHKLDKITFADLKVPIDPSYEPKLSFNEAKTYINQSLKVLGEEYLEIMNRALEKRWIDYGQNIGKSTGAFCFTPYASHPFILMNFTGSMRDVFVLAHELGHAGNFYLSNRYQNILSSVPSTFFFEAPSTMNEMLLANYLLQNSNDLRFKRWVLSNLISRTYFHNFVTHLLEAAFQREVYYLIDNGESVSAPVLSSIKRDLLEKFWGDDIEINEGAELTWMRQPHYYNFLYPYTYSAGLTIGTQVSKRILKEGQIAVDQWLEALKAGGSKSPIELGKMVGVDYESDEALLGTISYIGELIDQVYELTEILDNI